MNKPTTTKNHPGRPATGRTEKRLVTMRAEISKFLNAERERTGKPLNRILEDLIRSQMPLKPTNRLY